MALDTPAGLIAVAGRRRAGRLHREQGEHVAYAHDAQAAVLEVLEPARAARRARSRACPCAGPSLEDVFLNLTGREFRE